MSYTTQLSLLDRDWCSINQPLVLSAMAGRSFTADDLHAIVPEPDNCNLYGVLMAKLASAGLIRRVGSRKSTRAAANGRWVGVYEVVQ